MKQSFRRGFVSGTAALLLLAPMVLLAADSPGRGPGQWRAQFNTSANRVQKNVYPGIDLVLSGSSNQLIARFIVQPNADLNALYLDLSGAQNVQAGEQINALDATSKLNMRVLPPKIFQAQEGKQHDITGQYVQRENGQIGIAVEAYDAKQPLIITVVTQFYAGQRIESSTTSSLAKGGAPTISTPPGPDITATKTDQVVPDADNDGSAIPGETIKYTVTITNNGTDATNTVYNDLIDPNTTFTPGSLKMTPLAFANNYMTQPNTTISRSTSDPDDLLDNDNLGVPAATIARFGGGSLGGAVTGHAAGSTVSPLPSYASGSLTVNANGSFSFTPPTGFTGNYTFDYRLTNSAGSSDATVSFAVQAAPSAVADNYNTPVNTTLTINTASGLLSNDDLGSPAATLTSFGGGSLGGAVTDHAAGASVALAGGTLTVNADGSFSLTTPTVPGSFTFQYRLDNGVGTSDATVTIEVRQAPTAVADNYGTAINTPFSRATSDPDDLLDNDSRGFPLATITSFGGGTLGGTVTTNLAGNTANVGGHSLTVNADGSFTYSPATGFTGNFTFSYRITNVAGSSDATVTIAVEAMPVAVADNYNTPVNTTLNINTASGLLSNDDLGSPAATVTHFGGGSLGGAVTDHAAGASVALAGGTLTVNADGSFSLTTPTVTGSFTFQYRLTNVSGTSDALVTIEVRQAPTAVADNYNTLVTNTLSIAAPGLLGNDTRGFPLANVTSFGGGSLGGAVTDHAAGTNTALAGGTLQVNSDGSFSLTTPAITGSFTFNYRITNSSGTSDALVTIEVRKAPVAVNDGPYTVSTGGTLTITTADANDLLDNDDRGFPLANIASFGGGSLSGDATTNTAGGPGVALAGGTLTVGTDGSFSLATPTTAGSYTFQYRLSNVVNFSDATVTINVLGSPVAVNDPNGGLPTNSTPSNDGTVVGTDHPYHTALNTNLSVLDGANDLLANDNLGFPIASIISYGTTGSPGTQTSIGTATPTNQGGSVTVQANGSFSYAPPSATFTGTDQFAYVIDNGTTPSTATVTIAVGVRPAAVADSRTATGNVRLSTAANLLSNDTGDQLTVTAFDASSAQGGNVTVAANGSFTYNPPAGYEGSDSFNYTAGNGFGSGGSVAVSITVSDMIWFINNTAAVGNGRLTSPFNTLAAFQAVNNGTGNNPASGDDIFIYTGSGSYTGGVTLLNNQRVIGDGASGVLATILGITLAPGSDALPTFSGNDPVITSTTGNGINVAMDNTLRGLTVGNTPPSNAGVIGNGIGTLNITDVSINGSGQILSLNLGTLNASFNELSTSISSQDAIVLSNLAGSLTDNDASGSSINGTTAGVFNITGPTLTTTLSVTYNGNVTHGGTNPLVFVQNHGTGTITFQNNVMSSSGGGLTFINADGTYNFNGSGCSLAGSARIAISGGASGSFNFNSSTGVINPSNVAFDLDGSNATVDYNGSLNSNTAFRLISITNNTGGSASFDGSLNAFGNTQGIHIASNTGGTFSFTNASKIINTSATANTAVNVASNTGVTINFTNGGLDIDSNTGIGFNASDGSSITVSGANNSINTTSGTAIDFDGPTLNATFASVSSAGSGGAGIQLDNIHGTLTMSGGSITTASGNAFDVGGVANNSGGDAVVTYAGSITNTSGNCVVIQELSGGSYTLSGTITQTGSGVGIQVSEINNGTAATVTFSGTSKSLTPGGSNIGVNLSTNPNGTISFTNGGLAITTTSGAGFTATGGGTVSVTTDAGTANTISSTTGTALNVANTNIAANNLNFRSISSNGGSATGIILDNTGTTVSHGGLIVNGDGTNTTQGGNSSGGTIANKTGADGATTTGCGIYLNNTKNVVLRRMTINGTIQNHGIRGFLVNGFTLEYSTVNGTMGNSAAFDNYGEGCVYFGDDASTTTNGLTGSATVTSCVFSDGRARNFSVVNTAGTLNRLTITGTTFGHTNSASDNDALAVEARNSGTVVNVTVTGSTFTGAAGDLGDFTGQTSTTMDVIFQNNTCSNSHTNNIIGGGGMTFATQGAMTFNATGNTFRDANGSAINLFKASSGTSMSGTFSNNTIGVSNVTDSGSKTGNGIYVSAAGGGTMSYTINNNAIHQIHGNAHIYADNTGGSYTANFTIEGNTLDTPGAGWFGGILMTNGSPGSGDLVNVCAKIGGTSAAEKNNLNLGGGYGVFIGSSGANGGHTFNLPGLSASTEAAVENLLTTNNTGSFTVDAYVDFPATFAAFTGSGVACPTP